MRNADEIIINGIQSANLFGGLSLLQTFASIETLLASLPNEHLLFELFSTSYERSVNKAKISKLENYYYKSLIEDAPFDIPHVSLVTYGKIRIDKLPKRVGVLQYDRNESAIIDGYLAISAISNLLGHADPFTGKQASRCLLDPNQKRVLASLDLRLSIYYGTSGKVDEDTLSRLFFDINAIDTRVYSQYIITQDQESPLNIGAEKLALALNLNEIGGVAELNKITKSDSYVTTKNTLILILLASLGGKGARIDKKLPTHLPNNTPITDQIINDALKVVTPFMRGWISCLETKFRLDSNGFHRSMQFWQALGVVAYYLRDSDVFTESELFARGQVLGQLDYSKSASHWGNCKGFKKDASGRFWINGTGGGRTFRDSIADYFVSLL
ncbi:hypothetical protein AB4483_19245 [Vibrio splendidus]